jgi:hypothetical protein
MGRSGRGLLSIQSSKGGSPHLCWLKTKCLARVSKFDYVLAHTGCMGSQKFVVSCIAETEAILPCLMDV